MRSWAQKPKQPQKSAPFSVAQSQTVARWSCGSPSPFGHDFRRIPINPPVTGPAQAKLTVYTPGDEYEQEADRISEQIMRMREPRFQCACGGACPKCQASSRPSSFQAKHVRVDGARQISAPPIVHRVLASPGQLLDPGTRSFMEPRFGADFSHVRVHTGPDAAESARQIGARAYTLGGHIVFGVGEYAPASKAGRGLLTHELAHVLQQDGARTVGVVQRREVDDRSCPPDDIESDVNAHVNHEIAHARAAIASPSGSPNRCQRPGAESVRGTWAGDSLAD